MTTIAYKDGILVADSQISRISGDFCYRDSFQDKVRKVDLKVENYGPVYISEAGDVLIPNTLPDAIKKYLETGVYTDPAPDDEADAIVIINKLAYELYANVQPITSKYFALGSGRLFALGAMEAGASAIEAVAAAIELDVYSGYPIQGFNTITGEEVRFETKEEYTRSRVESELSTGGLRLTK